MTIKLASDDDYNRSHIYLDIAETRRAQRAADYLAHYEANRDRMETFQAETSLAQVILSAKFFTQPRGRLVGWKSAENGASTF